MNTPHTDISSKVGQLYPRSDNVAWPMYSYAMPCDYFWNGGAIMTHAMLRQGYTEKGRCRMTTQHTPGQVVKSTCIKECGCRAGADREGFCEIDHCPLHAAAPEMLRALERIARHGVIMGSKDDYRQGQLDVLESVHAIAKTALTLAQKTEEKRQ